MQHHEHFVTVANVVPTASESCRLMRLPATVSGCHITRVDISIGLVSILRVPTLLAGSAHTSERIDYAGNDEAWLHTHSQLVLEACRGAVAGISRAHVPGGDKMCCFRQQKT